MRSKREILITACSYVSGVAHRCLPKLYGIDQQRYCSSQIEDGDLFPSLPVGWHSSHNITHLLDSLLSLFHMIPACIWRGSRFCSSLSNWWMLFLQFSWNQTLWLVIKHDGSPCHAVHAECSPLQKAVPGSILCFWRRRFISCEKWLMNRKVME